MVVEKISKILESAEYWEYKEYFSNSTSVSIWNREIYKVNESKNFSFSVRVLYNGGWGMASVTKNITDDELSELAKKALKNAKISSKFEKTKKIFKEKTIKDYKETKFKIFPLDVSLEEKINKLFEYDKLIDDKRIIGKFFSYSDAVVEKNFFNSEGSEISQKLIRTMIQCELTALENGNIQTNFAQKAKTGGFETIENFENDINDASKTLIKMLSAKSFEGGKKVCIADGKLTAVIIHEALGHAAEADSVLQNQSCLKNLMNKKISNVNVVDDPTIPGLFGSFFYDDEGIEGKRKYIIKDGILNDFLHTRETAYKFNATPGNARAQGNSIPIARMSNTFIEPGDYKFDEMIEDLKDGFYLKGSRGGEVNPANGSFQFYVNEGYKIENGEIKYMVKGISIAGDTLKFLKNIVAVGDESTLSVDPGICGKSGQEVPVDGINPAIKIKDLKIGKN